jgi:hypothetical protein
VRLADPLTVVVKDAAGCTVRGTFESGVSPCDLPCGGEAVRQGFRFWVPEARPNLPINEYRVDPGGFTITDASGTVMDLRAEVAAVLLKFPNPIRTADYAAVVQRWLDGINEVVAAAVGSDQWLRLEYEPPTDRGTTGVLFVDHLTCVDFAFRLSVGFTQGKTQQSFNLRYAPDGTVISSPQAKLRIPPFSETSSNKCRPREPAVQRCEGTDLALELRRDGGHPDALVLGAAFSGTDAPVAFLWEVQDGIPSVAGGEKVSLTFQPVEPVDKLVRLTAFTEKGCSVTLEEVVNILKDNG